MIKSLDDVQDDKVRGKLIGLQELVTGIDISIEEGKKAILQKDGMTHACKVIAQRLEQEFVALDQLLTNDNIDVDECRHKKEQTRHIINNINKMSEANQGDIIKLRGRLNGMEATIQMAKNNFDAAIRKYEHRRNSDDDLDETGRPLSKKELEAKDEKPKKKRSKRKKKEESVIVEQDTQSAQIAG